MKKAVDILIVDDEPDYLIALSDVLKDKGYKVDTATGIDQLIAKARKIHFNVILTDTMLPGMMGAETFKEIREITPRTTIMVMSANYKKNMEKEFIKAGVYTCLLKPFNIDKLLELIERVKSKKGR